MSIRAKTFATILIAALLPLGLLGVLLHRSAGEGLVTLDRARAEALVDVIEERIELRDRNLRERLASLRDEAAVDQGLALAVAGLRERAAWPDEFLGSARRLTGLDVLMMIGADGGLLASAGDPTALGTVDPGRLRDALRRVDGGLGLARHGDGLMLARLDSLTLAGETITLLGGASVAVDDLADLSGGGITASLVFHGGALCPDDAIAEPLDRAGRERLSSPGSVLDRRRWLVHQVPYPRVRDDAASARPTPIPLVPATLVLSQSLSGRDGLLRDLDLRVLLAALAAALIALIASTFLAGRLTAPLRRLAARAEAVELDTLDADFGDASADEVGILASALGTMQERLRSSVETLRESERRALLGDLARQVNHDLRNGFLPIRNVVRHLDRVAREEPDKLPRVFLERARTLEMSLDYLENLATSWKRNAPARSRAVLRLDHVAAELSDHYGDRLEMRCAEGLALNADPTALRRILENLIRNGLEAGGDGPVRLDAARDGGRIRIEISDVGQGMTPDELARAFDMFHTTKAGGTGLGLPIVRRLVGDLGGEIDLHSAPGAGTTVTLLLDAADEEVPA